MPTIFHSIFGHPRRPMSAICNFGLIVCLFLSGCLLLSSCEKSNNMGQLRGQWQLLSIDYPVAGPDTPQPDHIRRYISFDRKVIQLTSTDEETLNFYKLAGSVSGDEPDLIFHFPYSEDPVGRRLIARWGIDENPAKAEILSLDDNRLVMKVGDNILTLRRF